MAEAKGLNKPVKLKNELAEFLGATELPRTEITKKLWDYIKANKLQTKTENGLKWTGLSRPFFINIYLHIAILSSLIPTRNSIMNLIRCFIFQRLMIPPIVIK